MADIQLIHRKLTFDPDLDLENAAELPGKLVFGAARSDLMEKGFKCSELVQDSHGWCFKISGDDARQYLTELIYVRTEAGNSEWVLCCDRLAGLRLWEALSNAAKNLGLASKYLQAVRDVLVLRQGFEVSN